MKNIHLLPTDKASRLRYNLSNVLVFTKELYRDYGKEANQNIYITSDEEIKKRDWCYDKVLNLIFQTDNHTDFKYVNQTDNVLKIILTTDQDLIKDGVQAIDDEFLEWFVKNPNCERVEVESVVVYDDNNNGSGEIFHSNRKFAYEIIIPQEEPKPHSFCETPEEKCTMNYCDENGCLNRKRELVESKQETLEEDAEIELGRLAIQNSKKFASKSEVDYTLGFIQGAKLQAEKMYSEKEVLDLLQNFNQNAMEYIKEDEKSIMTSLSLKKWFEQHKKK